MKKRIIFSLALLMMVLLTACGDDPPKSDPSAQESSTQAENLESEKEKPQQKDKKQEAETAKALAIFLDSQIYDNALRSEEVTRILQEGIQLLSSGKGTMLELYDLAKTTKDTQLTLFSNLSKLQDDNNKDYVESAQIYVSNHRTFSEKLMKYIDKNEMKYLSQAKESIESAQSYALSLIAARMTYLSSQGLTDEEINKILDADPKPTTK